MNITLLPYPHFGQSIACYTDSALLNTLILVGEPFSRLSNMGILWHSYTDALKVFGKICLDIAVTRGLKHGLSYAQVASFSEKVKHPWRKPLWLGWGSLHSSHKNALLHSGDIELVYLRILRAAGLINASWSAQQTKLRWWRRETNWVDIRDVSRQGLDNIHRDLDSAGAPSLTEQDKNHYLQFGWTEQSDGVVSVWPNEMTQAEPASLAREDCYA